MVENLFKTVYYNTPDGHEPLKKVKCLSLWGLTIGSGMAAYDTCMWSRPKNVIEIGNVAAYWIVPLTAMGASYAAIAYMATKIRGKDDCINPCLGALAAAGTLHLWQKDIRATAAFAVAACLVSATYKDDRLKDGSMYNMYARTPTAHQTLNRMSVYKEGRRKWEM